VPITIETAIPDAGYRSQSGLGRKYQGIPNEISMTVTLADENDGRRLLDID